MISIPLQDLYPWSFLALILLSIHTFRKGSLQLSGTIAAFLIGYLTLANENPIFGTSLLVFFFLGNQATKYKHAVKSALVEDEHSTRRVKHDQRAQKTPFGRDWKQVLCNAWLGTGCAVLHRFLVQPLLASGKKEDDIRFLRIKATNTLLLSDTLLYGALAFWSGCSGDTLASELGMLSPSWPRLITTLKPVPPGTNGAVSLLGLGLSALGGVLIGLAVSLRCMFEEHVSPPGSGALPLIIKTGFFGLFCSVLDSLLGATLQLTLYSPTEKKIVHPDRHLSGSKKLMVVTGVNLFTNNQVNIVSSTVTAILAMSLSWGKVI